ncbi:hypothetical protein OsJ_08502 [Oryza sativa Japonica Group]|uniref:Uncharacterized protein n=1 Tax=Oryza sativa subsp. japonica TaxID=39947 RepID=A3ABP1_ORYSJ|nr:hypothetical protein OsJ_08502 [Oryza sativa Japonica Group]
MSNDTNSKDGTPRRNVPSCHNTSAVVPVQEMSITFSTAGALPPHPQILLEERAAGGTAVGKRGGGLRAERRWANAAAVCGRRRELEESLQSTVAMTMRHWRARHARGEVSPAASRGKWSPTAAVLSGEGFGELGPTGAGFDLDGGARAAGRARLEQLPAAACRVHLRLAGVGAFPFPSFFSFPSTTVCGSSGRGATPASGCRRGTRRVTRRSEVETGGCRRYENGDRLSPEHEKAILERLLPYHPQYEKKIGCGIDYLTVGLHPEFENSRCLFIVRKDGEQVDFSFWKCIKGLIRQKYPMFRVLRHTVRSKGTPLHFGEHDPTREKFGEKNDMRYKQIHPYDGSWAVSHSLPVYLDRLV